MNGYIINFIVYTMAMVGIMFLSVLVYKKSTLNKNFKSARSGMKIEESLNISPKKTLYVVNVENEKFLIASDMERTSFLAKLNAARTAQNENFESYLSTEQIPAQPSLQQAVQEVFQQPAQPIKPTIKPSITHTTQPLQKNVEQPAPKRQRYANRPQGQQSISESTPTFLQTLEIERPQPQKLQTTDEFELDVEEMRQIVKVRNEIRKDTKTMPVMKSLANQLRLRRG